MIKYILYFFPTFPHFFMTVDDYLFSSKPADLRMLSGLRQKIGYCLLGCSNGSNQVGNHTGIC